MKHATCCQVPGLLESTLAKDWDSPEDAIYDDNQHTDTIGVTVTHWSSNGSRKAQHA